MSIPKIINYCWFGRNELTPSALKCINSWKKYCPDYTIVRWDETNFDVNKYLFTKEAYEKEKWAFVTDVARLDILYNNGGIYFDTDVELIKNIDSLLQNDLFLGFENNKFVANGLGFGAIKGNRIIKKNLLQYTNLSFSNCKKISEIVCPKITSKILINNGFIMDGSLQTQNKCTIYPVDYFCPMSYDTGKITITENTYSIHHYAASWLTKQELIRHKFQEKFNRCLIKLLGEKKGKFISRKLAKFTFIIVKPFIGK